MIINKLNQETFEHWMAVERDYAAQERRWACEPPFDYTRAQECNQLRWRAMELALDSLQHGLTADPFLRIGRA